MSLTIDVLSPKFMLAKEISHVTPTRSDHTGLGALCAIVFESGLGPSTTLALGGDSYPQSPNSDDRLAGSRVGQGVPLHQRSPSAEPRHVVGASGVPDAVGSAHHATGATGGAGRVVRHEAH
jgi:hypothetical protein